MDRTPKKIREGAFVESLYAKVNVDNHEPNKYFGINAREEFFNKLRWLDQQRSITITNPAMDFRRVHFEKEKDCPHNRVPLDSIRLSILGVDQCSLSSVASSFRSRPTTSAASMESILPDITIPSLDGESSLNTFQSRFKSKGSTSLLNEAYMLKVSAFRSGRYSPIEIDDFDEECMLQQLPGLNRPQLMSRSQTSPSEMNIPFSHSCSKSPIAKSIPDKTISPIVLESISSRSVRLKTIPTKEESPLNNLNELNSHDDLSSVSSVGNLSSIDFTSFQAVIQGEEFEINSPRSRFISGCMKERLNPRASLLLRRNMTKHLNLKHLGMGDKIARLLAEALNTLPDIESIDIADNGLTDFGLGPIILAAAEISSLRELNLSQNEIGPISAKALFDYLVSPKCPLEHLILNDADVDDFECGHFIEAVKKNRSLSQLEMSNNKIGSAENLNTVMPDIVTGGEAIADLLKSPDCHLKKLSLDWNMIRLEGANVLADSLSFNKTLTHLDLSYNTLSTEGGIILGVALIKNNSLETLVIANNGIDAVACITICAGIIENFSLRKVVLDGNPIGLQGMKAMMLVPMLAGHRVKMHAAACNVSIKDARCWFDFNRLIREYELNMEDGFQRAIAIIVLQLVAGHHSLIFASLKHEIIGRGGSSRSRTLELVQIPVEERFKYFDSKQKAIVEGLERVKLAASDIHLAAKLFQEVDDDGSGELEIQELRQLMNNIGLKISDKRLEELMYQFDTDSGGKIEQNEFILMLKFLHREANARMREILQVPMMALKSDKKKRFVPPDNGRLYLAVQDGFQRKSMYRVMSSCDRDYLEELASTAGDGSGSLMLSSSLELTKLRLDEGLAMAESIVKDTGDRVNAVKRVIGRMNDSEDAKKLMTDILQGKRKDINRLRRDLGAAIKPLLGSPNGYYILDLSKETDRTCLQKLLEISITLAFHRKVASKIQRGRLGDLSQKGNFSSFRNEIFNGNPITLTPDLGIHLKLAGKLEFDFSGNERPDNDVLVIGDQRIISILLGLNLLEPKDVGSALLRLAEAKHGADRTLNCAGVKHIETSLEKACLISDSMDVFYSNLSKRSSQATEIQDTNNFERDVSSKVPMSPMDYLSLVQNKQNESKLIAEESSKREALKSSEKNTRQGSMRAMSAMLAKEEYAYPATDTESEKEEEDQPPVQDSDGEVEITETVPTEEEEEVDGLGDEALDKESSMLQSVIGNWQSKLTEQPKVQSKRINIAYSTFFGLRPVKGDELFQEVRDQIAKEQVSESLARRVVELLEGMLGRNWILCRHLALIVECFAFIGLIKSSRFFGTYRVELIIALFSRLVDIHNFELITEILTPFEVACVICRIGWLNFYNPCKPEGSWELDLSRREERTIAKTLSVLATHEPGDNWLYQQFRWLRNGDPMPGWELTQAWLTDEGFPMRGILTITYYSGEGKGLQGCRPYVQFRKSLLNLVLINEEEIVREDQRMLPIHSILPGSKNLMKHLSLWDSFLAPAFVDPNRKR